MRNHVDHNNFWCNLIVFLNDKAHINRRQYESLGIEKHFPGTRDLLESAVEKATKGDSPMAAYVMVRVFGSSIKWAKSVIENARFGNPSEAAYKVCSSYWSDATREWSESVIENDIANGITVDGDPTYWAAISVEDNGLSREWYERVRNIYEKRMEIKNEK
jgi:hypothetical protein